MVLGRFQKKKEAGPKAPEAIAHIRGTLEMLDKRQEYLQHRSDALMAEARKNATTNKRAALLALKKKKLNDAQLAKLDGARMTLETQIGALEEVHTNRSLLEAMKFGAEALKAEQSFDTVDQVQDTMDDIADSMQIANEVSDALSQPIGSMVDIDDDELAEELAALQAAELDERMLQMPTTPTGTLQQPTAVASNARPAAAAAASASSSVDDDEIRQLQAQMSL